MKEWEDLDKATLDVMLMIGKFSPTANPEYREVKGYMLDEDGEGSKCYLTSDDLRDFAAAFNRVADWLDMRAAQAELEKDVSKN